MPYPQPFNSDTKVYRFYITAVTTDGHRFLASETMVSTTPGESIATVGITATVWANVWKFPFGTGEGYSLWQANAGWVRLWPSQNQIFTPVAQQAIALNSTAPEACFRLQRVGAANGLGRINLPILADKYFTDLPHRRHVTVSDLQPLLDARVAAWANPIGGPAQSFYRAIVHRRQKTWEPVVRYQLLRNPTRIWRRWRQYDFEERGEIDSTWAPDEFRSAR